MRFYKMRFCYSAAFYVLRLAFLVTATCAFTFCVFNAFCVFTVYVLRFGVLRFAFLVTATCAFTFCVFNAFCVFTNAFGVLCVLRFCFVAFCVLRFCRFVTVAVFGFYQCVWRFVPEVRFLPL